jgi:DNA-binding transcriptional LysR family regulator
MELRVLRYFVAVAQEGHLGRAAARLHMTQPPLGRAVHRLEEELGVKLFDRTATGIALTAAGSALQEEATALLDHADRVAARVRDAAGTATLVVGTLADTADLVAARIVPAFRARHGHVTVTVRESDLADPSAGLRTGLVDVALTRTPFDRAGIEVRPLTAEPVGVVLRSDDPLAEAAAVSMTELADRPWVQLPEGTDPVWAEYWTGRATPDPDRPVMRTIGECLQAALWNGTCALAPTEQQLPPGLSVVPVTDREPSGVVLAWRQGPASPLVRSFLQTAIETFGGPRG